MPVPTGTFRRSSSSLAPSMTCGRSWRTAPVPGGTPRSARAAPASTGSRSPTISSSTSGGTGAAWWSRTAEPGYGPAPERSWVRPTPFRRRPTRRSCTVVPELPEATLQAAVEVDHLDHEALVAVPLLSTGIVGECRFIRLPDQLDTAEVGVTVVDAWQGRGLATTLLARLSEHAL